MQEMLEGALRCEGQGCADGAGGALCPAGEAVSIRRRVGLGLAIGMRSAFPGRPHALSMLRCDSDAYSCHFLRLLPRLFLLILLIDSSAQLVRCHEDFAARSLLAIELFGDVSDLSCLTSHDSMHIVVLPWLVLSACLRRMMLGLYCSSIVRTSL